MEFSTNDVGFGHFLVGYHNVFQLGTGVEFTLHCQTLVSGGRADETDNDAIAGRAD
jgi:hypothetical protein